MPNKQVQSFFEGSPRVFLAGIGGVSMRALARVLKSRGLSVAGSDQSDGDAVQALTAEGIPVHIGHRAENIAGCTLLVRTAAVPDTSPEVEAARAQGIPVISRAQAWGELMQGYEDVLCVAGTHGKSSVTGMSTHIAIAAGLDPTVMIGAALPEIGGTHRIGAHRLFIAEACEYCNSFLSFRPTVALINNIEAEHLDFFKDLDDVISSFSRFAALVPPTGAMVLNTDDENVRRMLGDGMPNGTGTRLIRFGMGEAADVTAREVEWERGFARFTLVHGAQTLGRVRLQVPGMHNLRNALAAAAGALALGVDASCIVQGLSDFRGISRRFEVRGHLNGALVVDDYAHHPTEIRSALAAAAGMGFSRIIVVFQPHTYTRTAALADDIAHAFADADEVILTDIYAAREAPVPGVSAEALASHMTHTQYIGPFGEIAAYLRTQAREGDLIMTMGAGSITSLAGLLTGG